MPVVPTPPTIRDEVTPSSKWNQFRDAISFLQQPPIAELRQTVAQSIPNTTFTALTFDTEDVDTDPGSVGGHSTSSDTSRFTARYPGWYQISGAVGWASNATGTRAISWSINGVTVNGSQLHLPTLSGAAPCIPTRTKNVYLAANDYVELLVWQSSGGALNTSAIAAEQSHMSVKWVSQ